MLGVNNWIGEEKEQEKQELSVKKREFHLIIMDIYMNLNELEQFYFNFLYSHRI